MIKKKNIVYSAKIKKPDVIEIDYGGKKCTLGKGDKVIVVQTTGIPVRNRLTGKILGNREAIVGRGVIGTKTTDTVEIHMFPNAEIYKMKPTNGKVDVIVKKMHSD